MCAWRVDQMVDHLNVSYLYKKRGVFYFSKRVPCDVKVIMNKLEKLGAIKCIQKGKSGSFTRRANLYRREV